MQFGFQCYVVSIVACATFYRVDMTVFPNLAKIPWYQATVNAGDCFYLPYMWVHQVTVIKNACNYAGTRTNGQFNPFR